MAYLRKEHVDGIDAVLRGREEAGSLLRVTVEGVQKIPYWVRPADLERLSAPGTPDRSLRIVSPFDPFLIHRKRIRRLFGFDFAIECYLPAAKRTFGYFALPLFQGTSFVGLLDAKADRGTGELRVQNLRFDGPAKQRARFVRSLKKALDEFARFNGVAPPSDLEPKPG